jgi:outer membrane receptor protein involved in Fe transport
LTEFSWKKRMLATTLFASIGGSLVAGVAIAQEATDTPVALATGEEEAAVQDKVVITGSRLVRSVDTPVAVTTIGAEYIDQRAFNNVIDAIQELPAASLGTNLEGANFTNNDFTANANLLNLGTNRTLTLVNGRRFVSSNQATVFVPGNSNGAQVDLTLINPALIERVEAVVGSAGASTYGADAVGGVINLILKDDFEGLDLSLQGGITSLGDGETFRASGLYGKNFFDDRANITIGLEYADSARVAVDAARPARRNEQAFISPFNTGATTLFAGGYTNPFNSVNGVLVTAPNVTGSSNSFYYPGTGATAFNTQFGAQPFFCTTAACRALNSNLFVGSFGQPGGFTSITNPNAATVGSLPRLAVPLQFNSNGDLVPYNIGNIGPGILADSNSVPGGDGLPVDAFGSDRGAQQRFSANMMTRFDVTPNITYKGEYYYADVKSATIDGTNSNGSFGSTTGGTRAIPIYIDQNPLLSAQAITTLNGLAAQGLTIPTIGGQRVLYMNRILSDIDGGIDETSDSKFYRVVQSVEGEFAALSRDFNWDAGVTWGKVERNNGADTLLDIEFALASDVVRDANGNLRCHQQTLATPQDISIRTPQLAFVNGPRVPTAAQVAACVPLNLFGAGSPSQAAIDYVSSSTASYNESEQLAASAQFGGDLIDLPGGTAVFSLQGEYRKEENTFVPGSTFGLGLGRATTGRGSQGQLEFMEGGIEANIPIFGEDFTLPFVKLVELDGAYRAVSRVGESVSRDLESERVTEYVYRYGGRYQPFDTLTLRGSLSTSVRSPSIVELFGAGIEGFSAAMTGNSNPCDVDSINNGPGGAGGPRPINCAAFAAALGLPSNFLATFQSPSASPPAAGASNPFLNNEESETFTYGFVYQPDFIPGLTISADYYDLELTGAIALTSIASECFDTPQYPNSIVDGINACDAVVFGVPDPNNPGAFIVPAVNPITGNPVRPPAQIGSPAQTNAALNSTFTYFDTLNLGATQLEAVNAQASYAFDLEDLFGTKAANWGAMNINASAYYINDLNRFAIEPGRPGSTANPNEGEHTDPRLSTVLSVSHNIGKLSQTLQWFRDSGTVGNVLQARGPVTEVLSFDQPAFNMYNYNLGYQVTENVEVRVVVNNLFNEFLDEPAFLDSNGAGRGDVLGRRFTLAINARF